MFNAKDEIAEADNYPLIRLFTAALKTADTPQTELLGIVEPWSIASSSKSHFCIGLHNISLCISLQRVLVVETGRIFQPHVGSLDVISLSP